MDIKAVFFDTGGTVLDWHGGAVKALARIWPAQGLAVVCHNFDLNGAHAAGFRTAFVRRPQEWGPQGPPDPNPNRNYDFVLDGFEGLVRTVLRPNGMPAG